jgi:hypothetical protein
VGTKTKRSVADTESGGRRCHGVRFERQPRVWRGWRRRPRHIHADLKSLEKRNLLTFPYNISTWSFSADGRRLFVLTANQMAYIFDCQSLDKAESTMAVGH